MKFGVIIFPGSNCDHDALYALTHNLGQRATEIWHESEELGDADAVFVPGGFSYGDYLRCGAIARFSPVIRSLRRFADSGGLVIGVCNGFQILCEAGLLDGALIRNQDLRFVCRTVELVPGTLDSAFTSACQPDRPLRIPVAHGEGCFFADEATLDRIEAEDRVAPRTRLRYRSGLHRWNCSLSIDDRRGRERPSPCRLKSTSGQPPNTVSRLRNTSGSPTASGAFRH